MLITSFFLGLVLWCTPGSGEQSTTEPWSLNWFPRNPEMKRNLSSEVHSNRQMGKINSDCDDGKTNLTLDDDGTGHLCTGSLIFRNSEMEAQFQIYEIPERYVALHRCMDEAIEYDYRIPAFGTHRGLWPKYGEYGYVPVQRWLHTLEHGGVVMLYHPCTDKSLVNELRTLVTGCLYRHVITPSERLTLERPLALVAWGVIVQMSSVNKDTVIGFIQSHSLKGPEKTSKDGQFDVKLIKVAETVSDLDDYQLCPFLYKT